MSSVSRARAHVRGHPRASPRRTHASTARIVHRARRHYFPSTASTAPRPPRAFARVHHRPIARGRSPREVIHPRARASNHPSPSSSPARRRRRTRRDATREHARPRPEPLSLSLARIASHRLERDAPTTPRARVMRRPPRARRLGSPVARRGGRVAEAWGSRGGTDDESRSVTNDRARARGGIRAVDRAIGRVDRPTADDKNGPLSHTYGPSTTVSGRRTIVTYIQTACRCVCMGWVVVTRRSVGRPVGRPGRARAIRSIRSAVGRRSTGRWRRRRRARRRRRRRARRRRDAGWGGGVAGARGRWRGRGWGRAR